MWKDGGDDDSTLEMRHQLNNCFELKPSFLKNRNLINRLNEEEMIRDYLYIYESESEKKVMIYICLNQMKVK